jgi:hypothetical protein
VGGCLRDVFEVQLKGLLILAGLHIIGGGDHG